MKLIGPFSQLVSMANLPLKGKISDENLEIINHAGILIEMGNIFAIGNFTDLQQKYPQASVELILGKSVVMPAFIDCHTHLCFGGERSRDFAYRNAGKTYLEIAESGGGIWSSVQHTREITEDELDKSTLQRIKKHLKQGIASIEIKSGYGLNLETELKMLRCIHRVASKTHATLIPTCLAAHIVPKDFEGSSQDYLNWIMKDLLPTVKNENLSQRVDIFVEKSAFSIAESKDFLQKAKSMGFEICIHADQFTPGSARLACEIKAKSADHLEASENIDIQTLANSDTVAVALPGASLGLGEKFAPARKLLDAGACLAIATDWNPGSAPMGDLITQASILASFEKLTTAEVLAGITFRAAHALSLNDRGVLKATKKADFVCFPTHNYQEILYQQGQLRASELYINGEAQRIDTF